MQKPIINSQKKLRQLIKSADSTITPEFIALLSQQQSTGDLESSGSIGAQVVAALLGHQNVDAMHSFFEKKNLLVVRNALYQDRNGTRRASLYTKKSNGYILTVPDVVIVAGFNFDPTDRDEKIVLKPGTTKVYPGLIELDDNSVLIPDDRAAGALVTLSKASTITFTAQHDFLDEVDDAISFLLDSENCYDMNFSFLQRSQQVLFFDAPPGSLMDALKTPLQNAYPSYAEEIEHLTVNGNWTPVVDDQEHVICTGKSFGLIYSLKNRWLMMYNVQTKACLALSTIPLFSLDSRTQWFT